MLPWPSNCGCSLAVHVLSPAPARLSRSIVWHLLLLLLLFVYYIPFHSVSFHSVRANPSYLSISRQTALRVCVWGCVWVCVSPTAARLCRGNTHIYARLSLGATKSLVLSMSQLAAIHSPPPHTHTQSYTRTHTHA